MKCVYLQNHFISGSCVCVLGAKYDAINPSIGPAHPEGPAVCCEDGRSTPWPGDQIQTGGGEPQTKHRQAIQGKPN